MKKIGVRFFAALTAVGLLFTGTTVWAKSSASTKEQTGKIKGVQTTKETSSKAASATAQEIPDYYSMIDNQLMVCYVSTPQNLSELENQSDTIVRATFLDVKKPEDLSGSDEIFTRSKIRIDEVYTGNVKPGDVIEIFEPYSIRKDQDRYIFTHGENYYPSEKGRSYIWILEARLGSDYDSSYGFSKEQTYYSLLYCERGRYPVISSTGTTSADIQNMTNRELNLSLQGNATRFRSIYAEVAEKYMGIPKPAPANS